MKNRVILLFLFVFTAILIVVSQTHYNQISGHQTNNELKQKYGSPDAKGQYIVRPEIGVTAKFKEDGRPIEMFIKPLDSSEAEMSDNSSFKVMLSDVVDEVLNELVPVAKRGKQGGTTNAEFGCTSTDYTEYEQVTINTVKRCEQQGGGTYSIGIRWKK